jgi:photosystem II stability/assembly factor-like uncharacterized protein
MRLPGLVCLLLAAGALLCPVQAESEEAGSAARVRRDWVEVGHGIRFGLGNTAMAMSHRDPRVVYVGTEVGYVYRSLDGGVTWDEVRLLPDDLPLLNVPLMDLLAIPFPNDGLLDSFVAPLEPSMFRRPFGSHGPMAPMSGGTVAYPSASIGFSSPSELESSYSYSLVDVGDEASRVETEDPGNLMALYFSGIAPQPGRVNWLETCPTDPTVAFAATSFGAYRTRDMGITWDRVFIGSSEGENQVHSVCCNPTNENLVVIATTEGLRFSRDGGDQWERPTGNLGSWATYFVTSHPLDPRRLLVGTDLGAYATVAGDVEETLYLADQPAPEVRNVTVIRGTSDPLVMYVGTFDGASYTHDGGRTWTRMAELLLGHYRIRSIAVDPRDPMHAYIETDYHMFETRDGGATLSEIMTGYTDFKFAMLDPLDPDVLWAVGYSQVWRYQPPERAGRGARSEIATLARAALRRDPGLDRTIDAALERAGLDQDSIRAHRRDIRRSAFVPTVDLIGWGSYVSGATDQNLFNARLSSIDYFYDLGCLPYEMVGAGCFYGSGTLATLVRQNIDLGHFGVFMVLSWPFGRSVMDERTTGRIWLDVLRMRDLVMYTVYDYWTDRSRVLGSLARGGNTTLEEYAYVMRLEEMTAVLDGLTDGLLGGPFGEERGGTR